MQALGDIASTAMALGDAWLAVLSAVCLMALLVVAYGLLTGSDARSASVTATGVPCMSTVLLLTWLGSETPGLADLDGFGPSALFVLGAWAVGIMALGGLLGFWLLVLTRRFLGRDDGMGGGDTGGGGMGGGGMAGR
ncbi:MAG: hypothetical protein AAF677_01895 [Pseudomonadota bacterium]